MFLFLKPVYREMVDKLQTFRAVGVWPPTSSALSAAQQEFRIHLCIYGGRKMLVILQTCCCSVLSCWISQLLRYAVWMLSVEDVSNPALHPARPIHLHNFFRDGEIRRRHPFLLLRRKRTCCVRAGSLDGGHTARKEYQNTRTCGCSWYQSKSLSNG